MVYQYTELKRVNYKLLQNTTKCTIFLNRHILFHRLSTYFTSDKHTLEKLGWKIYWLTTIDITHSKIQIHKTDCLWGSSKTSAFKRPWLKQKSYAYLFAANHICIPLIISVSILTTEFLYYARWGENSMDFG